MKRLYYVHAMCIYGTEIEKEEINLLKKFFPKHELIDPGLHEGNVEKSLKGMKYCYELIDRCDDLAFTRLLGKITSGVGLEINHALRKGIPVYRLEDNKLERVSKNVKSLSREDTIRLYEFWRNITCR